MNAESQRILEAYQRYKETGQGTLQEVQEENRTTDPQYQATQQDIQQTEQQQESNLTKLQLVERELTEYDNSLRSSGRVSESELQADPRHRQLARELATLQDQRQSNQTQIQDGRDALSMYDASSEADRFFSGGIDATTSPFDKGYIERKPYQAPSLTPSQRAEQVGKTNTFIDPNFSVSDIYEKQDRTKLANAEQRLYVSQLRQGGISIADALIRPKTRNTYSENNTINLGTFLTERGYDLTTPETIPNELFKPEKQWSARSQTSGELIPNTYSTASNEQLERQQLVKAESKSYQEEINAFRNVLNSSNDIKNDYSFAGSLEYLYPSKSNPSNQAPMEYNPLGQYAKGLTNTVKSYWNLAENTGNYITGQEQKPLSQTFTPIQDSFFGMVTNTLDDTVKGKPIGDAWQTNFDQFYARQSKRDPITIAGELSLEALLWAIPVAPAIQGVRYLAKTVPKFIGFGDNLTRVALEASTSPTVKTMTKSEKILDTNPDKKFTSTYQNTNPMRKSIDKDIFAQDTATSFSSQNVKLGSGSGKTTTGIPDNVGNYNAFIGESKSLGKLFQGARISLGSGIGSTKTKSSGGGGGFSYSLPKRPSNPPPSESKPINTNNGLQLLQDPKQISKQQTKKIVQPQFKSYPMPLGKSKPQLLKPQLKQKQITKPKLQPQQFTPLIKPQQSMKQQFQPLIKPMKKQQPMIKPLIKQTPRTRLTPLIKPMQKQPLIPALVPFQSQQSALAFAFPPMMDTIRKQKKKKKTKKEKLDSKIWNVPTDFIVGFGKEVRGEQSKFWGNIKGSKDQLARGYRRIEL